VSVVIPVYRSERHVRDAAVSALDQPETLEVILVEDGSPDGSLSTCRKLVESFDPRVRLLRHPGGANRGAAASRNLGVREARGRYVAFLDADDCFLPGRFAASVPILERDGSVDGVYEAVGVTFDGPGAEKEWHTTQSPEDIVTIPAPPDPEKLLALLASGRGGGFHTGGGVFRREALEKAGLFDVDLRLGQDRAMWWKMAAVCRLVPGNVRSPVAVYRRHGANRATVADPEYSEAPREIALSVYAWAKARRLPGPKLRILRRALADGVLRFPRVRTVGLPKRLDQVRQLARYCARFPEILLEPLIWRRVAGTASWTRLCRVIGLCCAGPLRAGPTADRSTDGRSGPAVDRTLPADQASSHLP
jgi:glycosyltransferase involved in cell wall biosynthesis